MKLSRLTMPSKAAVVVLVLAAATHLTASPMPAWATIHLYFIVWASMAINRGQP